MSQIIYDSPQAEARSNRVKFCYICSTYGQYDYARRAIESFLKHTSNSVVVVVDDGHPNFHKFWDDKRVVMGHSFKNRQGLTRSWNYGMIQAQEMGAQYTICGNDDVLFTPGWFDGPVALLEDDSVGVVGPLSNGPGLTNKHQNIWDHVKDYKPADTPDNLADVAGVLSSRYQIKDHIPVHAINGFIMIGRTLRWWEGRFDENHVFNPDRRFALTQNEDEMQSRFRKRGWRSLVSFRSYIFHYRSVTRGDKFKHGMWYRRTI